MYQQSLFYTRDSEPLASRMRPEKLEDIVGQQHLLGQGKILRQMIDQDLVPSMIFWGPPGVGKTTIASVIAKSTRSEFINFSAVSSGIKEIREVMNQAEQMRMMGQRTIVFVDEIHRFNKAQQDAFLPFVEKGSIVLIGATTENPSFEVNSALLSRCKVFVLHGLEQTDIIQLLRRTLASPAGYGDRNIMIEDSLLSLIAAFANGDARTALNTLEMVILNGEISAEGVTVTKEIVRQCVGDKALLYDKDAEEHYNIISAIHKSLRNSDVHAALYWSARMLEAGEDPLYIARRLIRFASEDIGMADSRALEICVAAYQACHFLGMPECKIHIAHAITYLAMAPKSRAVDSAYSKAAKDAKDSMAEPVPLQIRNAPTSLMEDLGYGQGYQYDGSRPYNVTNMPCLPKSMAHKRYYTPSPFGEESHYQNVMEQIDQWHREHPYEEL